MKKIGKKSAAIGLAVTLGVSGLAVRPVYTQAITEQTVAGVKPIAVTEETEAVSAQESTAEGTTDTPETETATLGAIDASGVLEGSKISWTYTAENQKLTFMGEGPVNAEDGYRESYLAYSECVKEIEIGEGIASVGSEMFSKFEEVETVILPSTLTQIGNNAFEYCKKIKNVEVPSSVSYIGEYAFCGTSIEKIEIPQGVKRLYKETFAYCRKLRDVTLPDALTHIDESCFVRTSIKEIVFPESLVKIGDSAFKRTKLEEVVLPDSVTTVGNDAFGTDTLKKVTVGKGLKKLEYDAFGLYNVFSSPYEEGDELYDIEGDFEMFGPEESVAKEYAEKYNIPYNGVVNLPALSVRSEKPSTYDEWICYDFKYWGATGVVWKMPYRATGYYVYRATKKNGTYKKIATLEGRENFQFVDTTAALGKTYYYKVSMYQERNGIIQEGKKGNAVAVKSESLALVDGALSYSEESGTPTIKCTWYCDQRASKFYIYRSTKANSSYKLIKTKKNKWTITETGDCTCTYKDTNIKKGTRYYYEIKAYAKVGTKTYKAIYYMEKVDAK